LAPLEPDGDREHRSRWTARGAAAWRAALAAEAGSTRRLFNDTAAGQLWFVAGAPLEAANTLEMTPETLAALYPDGPKALPPELS
jgi:hypothetical protein